MLPALAFLVGISDFSSQPAKSVSFPPAGGQYTDPSFGTTVTRLTDSKNGSQCYNAYSYWEAWNADETRLLLYCDGPKLWKFDPRTGTATPDGSLYGTDAPKIDWEGASWSNTDPNIIYGLAGMKLWKLDVSKRGAAGATLVHDFTGLFSYSFGLYQMSMSDDDNTFTFHSRSGGQKLDAVGFDRAANKVWIFPRNGYVIDETAVDRAGKWIVVYGNDESEKMWDPRTGQIFSLGWNSTDRVGGHYDIGTQLWFNGDNWNTGIGMRRLDAPVTSLKNILQYKNTDGSLNWNLTDHISLRVTDESFVLVSTYGGGSWAPFKDEVFMLWPDSHFLRLAHTYSSAGDYWAQPRACVSRSGRWALWTTDFDGSSRHDVLMVTIPGRSAPPPLPDAGVPDPSTPDAGTVTNTTPDANTPPPPEVDAASVAQAPDAGDGPPRISEGCSVGAGGAVAPWLLALLLVGIYRIFRISRAASTRSKGGMM
jgi:hypothetical protein